jgi:hypothetical protein
MGVFGISAIENVLNMRSNQQIKSGDNTKTCGNLAQVRT